MYRERVSVCFLSSSKKVFVEESLLLNKAASKVRITFKTASF